MILQVAEITVKPGSGAYPNSGGIKLDSIVSRNYLSGMSTTTEDTIANRISRVLADRIIAGTLEPGAKLKQDRIAEEFGTSHVPVREAFRRLAETSRRGQP